MNLDNLPTLIERCEGLLAKLGDPEDVNWDRHIEVACERTRLLVLLDWAKALRDSETSEQEHIITRIRGKIFNHVQRPTSLSTSIPHNLTRDVEIGALSDLLNALGVYR